MTRRCASTANSSVTFTLMPSASSVRTARAPPSVPGTLIMTLGRSTDAQSRRPSAIVASGSSATPGDTSMDT